jgi:hypothetical protein
MHAGLSVRRKSDGAILGMNPEIKKAAAPARVVASNETPAVSAQPAMLRLVGGSESA